MTRPPELPTRLRLVVTRLARRLRQRAETPVSPTQSAVLATIDRRGPLTLGDLADAERVQPPTITAAVDRLEQQGLVQRLREARDRRIVQVQITAAGEQLLEEARTRKSAYLEQQLGALSARDRATLERAASILERVLEEEE
ncbi:MAG: MarR family transcriptional regulator [Acidimicrobiia bacterium]